MTQETSKFKRAGIVGVVLSMTLAMCGAVLPSGSAFADCKGPTTLAELNTAINDGGANTITLCANINIAGGYGGYGGYGNNNRINVTKTATIDLNGNTISSNGSSAIIKTNSGTTLTLVGKGQVSANKLNSSSSAGNLVIAGGTYTVDPSNFVKNNALKAYKVGNNWNVETKLTADNFNVGDIVVRQGQTDSIEVVKPTDSTTGVSYLSADSGVATVTSAGVVTGIAVGNTTINVTPTYDNTIVKTIDVEVLPVLKTIDADDITIRVGKDDTIAPSVVEDASIAGATFTYESADEGVATVDNDGKVTGVSDGATTVTVTASYTDDLGEMTATKTVNVVVYDVQAGDNDEGGVASDTVKEIVDEGLPENMEDASDKQKEAFGADYKETGENLKDAINDGAKITTIVNIEDSVAPDDVVKTSIENALKANGINAKNIEYFDVSVEMKNGDAVIGNLHKLSDRIEVVLADVETPEAGYVRQYYVVKYHNGIPTVLKEGDGFVIENDKIKILSDEFSIFAVGYNDTLVAKKVSTPNTGANTSDGGSANSSALMAVATMSMATILAGAAIFAKRK